MKLKHTVEKYTWVEEMLHLNCNYIDLNIELTKEEKKQAVIGYLKCYWSIYFSFLCAGIAFVLAYFISPLMILVGVISLLGFLVFGCWLDLKYGLTIKYEQWQLSIIEADIKYKEIQEHNKSELEKKHAWEESHKLTAKLHDYCKYKNIVDLDFVVNYILKNK